MFIVKVAATRATLPVGSPSTSMRTGDAFAITAPCAGPVVASVRTAGQFLPRGFTPGSNTLA